MSITTISDEELQKDLQDSYDDIALCKTALKLDIVGYSGGSVLDRLTGNQRIVKVILAELARRNKLTMEARNDSEGETK